MEYKFKQFRRQHFNNYLSNIDFSLEDLMTQSELLSGTYFYDKKVTLNADNILQATDSTGTSIKSYYIKFRVYKMSSEQVIQTKLFYTFKQEDNEQILEEFTVPIGSPDDYVVFEMVIKPNTTYNEIHFILNRTLEDYNIQLEDPTKGGREMHIEVEKIREIYNVINLLKTQEPNLRSLIQIGIQAAPGLLMSIDGEGVHVGKTGQYEINYGISVSFLGFIIEPDDNSNFILDYQYRY